MTEGSAASFTLTRAAPGSGRLEVRVSAQVLPAAANAPVTVTFPSGASTVRFEVPVSDDRVLQAGREVVVTVAGADAGDGSYRVRAGQGEARVPVRDDEAPRLSLSAVRAAVPEGHGCANFLIRYADPYGAVAAAPRRLRRAGRTQLRRRPVSGGGRGAHDGVGDRRQPDHLRAGGGRRR